MMYDSMQGFLRGIGKYAKKILFFCFCVGLAIVLSTCIFWAVTKITAPLAASLASGLTQLPVKQ
jgi:hypothetical protein